MAILWRRVDRFGWLIGSVFLAWVAAHGLACGGAAAEEDRTLVPTQGGTTSTGGPAVCYGKTGPAPTVAVTKLTVVDSFIGGTGECIFAWGLAGYSLNPSWVFLYFTGTDGSRMDIPYVGTLADCASATSYGGWYATALTGASINIGLCACSCNGAHNYAFRLDVATAGIPK